MCGIVQLMRSKLTRGVTYNLSILHENASESLPRGITIHLKILAHIGQNQHWGCNQTLLQFLKTGFTFLRPDELGVLLQQFCHRFGNLEKTPEKSPVIPRKSKKTTDFTNGCGRLPFCDCFNLGWV